VFHKSCFAPVGGVVIGAGVMGSVHAESIADPKQGNLAAAVGPAEKQARTVARRLSALRVADAIQGFFKSGKPVALPG
jgi:predicted dehydrogenase